MSLIGHSKSSASVTPDKVNPMKNMVTLTISPLWKYPILPRKGTEYHVPKPHYKGSDNSHTNISHGEKDIQDHFHIYHSHGEK